MYPHFSGHLNPDMATGFPKGGRISLQSLPNTRDLGAIVTDDGQTYPAEEASAKRRTLSYFSRAIRTVLREAYNLKTVIDLRSGRKAENVNRILIMAGVEYYHMYRLWMRMFRVMRLPEDISELLQKTSGRSWRICEEI